MESFKKKFFLKLFLSLFLSFIFSQFMVEKVVYPSAPIFRPTFKKNVRNLPITLKLWATRIPQNLLSLLNQKPTYPFLGRIVPPAHYIPSPNVIRPTSPPPTYYYPPPEKPFFPTATPEINLPTATPFPFFPSPTSTPIPTPTPRPSPTPTPTPEPPAEPGPPLSILLDEINQYRNRAGTQPLTFTPQAGIEGMNRYLADLAPQLIQERSCHHGVGEPAKLGWDYIKQAGYNGSPHGEVLMCPGLCSTSYVAGAWWENGNGPHKEILYDDASIRSVACGYYQWNGQQAMMWGCVTYER